MEKCWVFCSHSITFASRTFPPHMHFRAPKIFCWISFFFFGINRLVTLFTNNFVSYPSQGVSFYRKAKRGLDLSKKRKSLMQEFQIVTWILSQVTLKSQQRGKPFPLFFPFLFWDHTILNLVFHNTILELWDSPKLQFWMKPLKLLGPCYYIYLFFICSTKISTVFCLCQSKTRDGTGFSMLMAFPKEWSSWTDFLLQLEMDTGMKIGQNLNWPLMHIP